MGLKLLHAADLHLDSPFASAPEPVRRKLQEQQRAIPGLLADLCRSARCDLVLLAGDVFDGEAEPETVECLRRELQRCEVPVFIAPGNHDWCRPGSPWLEENWPENVYIFTEGWQAVDLPELDCRVCGAGYQSMDCPPLLEGFHTESDCRWQIAVLHGDPTNASSPNCPVTAAQVRESGLDYLALGHIHRDGSFQAGRTLCAWPGCPMGRGWDETGEKGVYLVELDSSVQVQPVSLGLTCFYDLKADITEGVEQTLDALLPPAESVDCYRLTLLGSGEVDAAAVKARYSHLLWLEIVDETEEPVDLWDCIGEDSFRGTYFRMLYDQLQTAEPEQQKVILQVAALSRRLMDGKEVTLP